MSAFPGSPRLLKGAIIALAPVQPAGDRLLHSGWKRQQNMGKGRTPAETQHRIVSRILNPFPETKLELLPQ